MPKKIRLSDEVVHGAVVWLLSEEIAMKEVAVELGIHRNTLAKCIKEKVSYAKWCEIARRSLKIRRIRATRTQKAQYKETKTPAELKQLYNKKYVFLEQTEKEVTSEKARKEIALIKRVLVVMREVIMDENYIPEIKP